ncbi:helix-turn-helix domain-containing protein [Lewinella sp. 4G2]|uniref:helix-turn-helix domain-containing protein n=1 Tax=Lewinella sp. 4G2 TaxID=1803372 RepID=UPI0007B461F8|nr:helix-turn-helix domain-containing protein [Lewinella sp. 4G2]OAV44722.1 hypothetical protein A3850_009560 [Lewinella sp. 4G2]
MNKPFTPVPVRIDVVTMPVNELRQLITDTVTDAMNRATAAAAKGAKTAPNGAAVLPELLTRKEAAALLRVGVATLDGYVRDGMLTKYKVGRSQTRLKRDEVRELARLAQ